MNFGNDLLIYEDKKCLNKYNYKTEFLSMYETRTKEIKKYEEIMKNIFENEVSRIVKEVNSFY